MFITVIFSRKRLKLLGGLILVFALLLLTPLLNLPERLAMVTTRENRLVPIYYVDTPEKKVAFSFDASWGAERTPLILEILQENDIKTTFFLTGFWVEKYPDFVRQIAAAGHEIGNHTATHPHLSTCTPEQIREELVQVEEMITEISGQKPALFRPPFGDYTNEVIKTAAALNYQTIQWSVDSLDWQNLGAEEIIRRVSDRAHKGAIILFHNNGLHTAEALPEMIDYFHSHGYTILPISELIYHDNFTIDPHSGAQIKEKP